MTLNLGCGSNKIKGSINVDILHVKPDVVFDITRNFPLKDESVDEVYLFHTVEHIPEALHHRMFQEIWRVLEMGGKLFISYPEFEKIAKNYIENKQGIREFWKATIYGRQLYPTDFHVSLMNTVEFTDYLKQANFEVIKHSPEPREDFNTIVYAKKGPKIYFSRPELQKQLMEIT